jgi:hypothetical protein
MNAIFKSTDERIDSIQEQLIKVIHNVEADKQAAKEQGYKSDLETANAMLRYLKKAYTLIDACPRKFR